MAHRYHHASGLLLALFVFASLPRAVQAAFLVTITGQVTPATGGLNRYEYTLSVPGNGTFAATDFGMTIPISTAASSIESTSGWTLYYTPGDELIYWLGPLDGSLDAMPGESVQFAFLSPRDPGIAVYSTFGISLNTTESLLIEDEVTGPKAPVFAGDFNSDQIVDGKDFLKWQREVGTAGAGADGNADGIVNGIDLGIWREHFGEFEAAAIHLVPEPRAGLMVLFGALFAALMSRTWRA